MSFARCKFLRHLMQLHSVSKRCCLSASSNAYPLLLSPYFRLNLLKKRKLNANLQTQEEHLFNSGLEMKFCQSLRDKLLLPDEVCKEICGFCSLIFETQLSDEESIDEIVTFIAKNFSTDDILHNPQVFAIHPRTLKQRVEVFNELGFDRLSISQVDSLFHSQLDETPGRMKNLGIYLMDRDTVDYLVNHVDCPDSVKDQTAKRVGKSDFVKFRDIRQAFLCYYLAWKLHCSSDEAFEIVKKKASRISTSSVSNIKEGINFFTESNLPAKKILSSSLVAIDVKNAKSILENIDKIAGKDIKELIWKNPRILDTKYMTLKNNLELLKEFNIKNEQILRCLSILTFNNETLRKRLNLFFQTEEFKPFASNLRALQIVSRIKLALDRIEELRSIGCMTMTIDQLIGSSKYFEKVMVKCERPNNKNAIFIYLTKFLQINPTSVKSIGCHPYSNRLSTANANQVIDFLVAHSFSNEQLINGIHIVLYDCELVKQQYEEMTQLEELQPFETDWKNDPFVLQLVIYYIEKKYSFSGNGVFINYQSHKVAFNFNQSFDKR